MTTFNPRDISKFPGKLCVNPTDLSLPFPHGGTGLGVVRNIVFRPGVVARDVIAEEYGEVVEAIATGQSCILTATLQSWDAEALREIFWNTVEGSVSGRRGVKEHPTEVGQARAGFLLSSRSVVLLFSPDDTDKAPMLLIRRALPRLEESAEISLRLDTDISIGVAFEGIRSSAGKLYDWALRKDITL